MQQSLVTVDHLTKRFGPPAGGFTAVDDISFRVGEGEIVGLLGPNGAGKTTTIFMLLDLVTPTSGDIRIFGLSYQTDREAILQQLNYSSTYVEMSPQLTVYENLLVMAKLYRVSDPERKIQEYARKFGVTEFIRWPTRKLSAGQKTRVSLVKAFVNDPRLLLLDEPTASLDPDIAIFVRKEILEARKRGMTVLITSHNMAEVEEVCDRVLFIHQGKLIAEDTPEGLASRVRKVHVNLMMKDGQKRTLAFAKKAGFRATNQERFVTIDVDEEDIAYLLASLADLGVSYKSIAIDKPTLEDFFVQASKKRSHL